MKLNEYQNLTQRTVNLNLTYSMRLATAGLGLSGEAGEVTELIKKHVGHGHDLNREHMKKELGDVLWYVAECAALAGFTLEEVAQANIDKLSARYPEGFSEWRSVNRTDE